MWECAIDPGYTMAMMGHASDISASYLEKSDGLFLKEYVRVESYLVVYGVEKTGVEELRETVEELEEKFNKLVTYIYHWMMESEVEHGAVRDRDEILELMGIIKPKRDEKK